MISVLILIFSKFELPWLSFLFILVTSNPIACLQSSFELALMVFPLKVLTLFWRIKALISFWTRPDKILPSPNHEEAVVLNVKFCKHPSSPLHYQGSCLSRLESFHFCETFLQILNMNCKHWIIPKDHLHPNLSCIFL